MKILVSACLMGQDCKYNGKNNYNSKLVEQIKDHEIIAVCPEVMGGLPTPREQAEIVDGVVRVKSGNSVDKEFRKGASLGLQIAKENGIDLAILKSKSPSCSCKKIYDGTFSGRLIEGMGVFAELLVANGIRVIDENDL